ncbi:MAG: hypothetical protein OEV94_02130 [Deltaproteobacteria bacterium]|nr:hypothetical protein [Deltaproteobacteria bacterium]
MKPLAAAVGLLVLLAAEAVSLILLGWQGLSPDMPPVLLVALAALSGGVSAHLGAMLTASWLFPEDWREARMSRKDLLRREEPAVHSPRVSWYPHRVFTQTNAYLSLWDAHYVLLLVAWLTCAASAGYTAWRMAEGILPNRPLLAPSLHQPVLSSLPVMREMKTPWSLDPELARKAQQELIAAPTPDTNLRHLQNAQWNLLAALTPRKPHAPWARSPGEWVAVDQAHLRQAVAQLDQLLAKPDAQRVGWTGGTLTLKAFCFLLMEQEPEAKELLDQAMATFEPLELSGIPPYVTRLLSARLLIHQRKMKPAETLLTTVMNDKRLPAVARPLAMEQLAEVHRLQGHWQESRDLLSEAGLLHGRLGNLSGNARVQLAKALLFAEAGRPKEAMREASQASSLAWAQQDGFTIDMLEVLNQYWVEDLETKAL